MRAKGLQEYWDKLLDVLSEVADTYEKANKLMTLFSLSHLRSKAAIELSSSRVVLDAGCGPGVMYEYTGRYARPSSYICLDPLLPMIRKAKRMRDEAFDLVRGVFEHLPFRDEAFDSSLNCFSLRDAKVYAKALLEQVRVLRGGGRLVVLDVYKGRKGPVEAFRKVYFSLVPPLVGLVLLGRRGQRLYRGFAETYARFVDNEALIAYMRSLRLGPISFRRLLGMAALIVATKPSGKEQGTLGLQREHDPDPGP